MPHSSGGGSHGGGSHRSSHGGGSSGSAPRVSRKPYPGARRYIYYYPGTGRHEYLYYQGIPGKPLKSALNGIYFSVIVLLLIAGFQVRAAFVTPVKTELIPGASSVLILDEDRLLGDTDVLTDALQAFQDKTGVTPAIEIVDSTDWKNHYGSLESFAYSEYLRLFDDEVHWLFVISYPEADGTDGFVDWAWEGMIGDDVGQTITSTAEDNMTEVMQKYLLRSDADTLCSSIAAAFREFSLTVMDSYVDYSAFTFVGFILLFGAFLLISGVSDYKRKVKLSEASPVPMNSVPREHNCEYCGCMYVEGTVSLCPQCGAPIPAAQPAETV